MSDKTTDSHDAALLVAQFCARPANVIKQLRAFHLRGFDVNAEFYLDQSCTARTFRTFFCETSNVEAVQFLVQEAHADVELPCSGQYPLQIALESGLSFGSSACLRILLEAGANPSRLIDFGNTGHHPTSALARAVL